MDDIETESNKSVHGPKRDFHCPCSAGLKFSGKVRLSRQEVLISIRHQQDVGCFRSKTQNAAQADTLCIHIMMFPIVALSEVHLLHYVGNQCHNVPHLSKGLKMWQKKLNLFASCILDANLIFIRECSYDYLRHYWTFERKLCWYCIGLSSVHNYVQNVHNNNWVLFF